MIGFREYIDFAEHQLELAEREIDHGRAGDLYLIPSVILAWSAIEINEALCKVLCHNLCVVLQSVHELGIETNFEAALAQ